MHRYYISIYILFCSLGILSLSANDDSEWKHGIVRVNTNVSAGIENFAEVAQQAEYADLDYVVFTDQFLVYAEYGISPLRNILKISKERKSVLSYGIQRYLDEIKAADRQFPDITLIPGADIAPHYFWKNTPLSSDFSCDQFSEQLTVLGPDSVDFYAKLPVIHNEQTEVSWKSALKMLPLLLALWGILLIKNRNADTYCDRQGNIHNYSDSRKKVVIGISMILLGLLWSANNRPFTCPLPFDQYRSYGLIPYQNVIDYIRKNSKENTCGIFWSAPEATMKDRIGGVKLITYPYLDDVVNTENHNGLAGIYGDAFTAQEPGNAWDQMLMEYCMGKRKVRPVIIGELDYHGKKRRIDMIQTVVRVKSNTTKEIVKAICSGNSYAYLNVGQYSFSFEKLSLNNHNTTIGPGEILLVNDKFNPVLQIKGVFNIKAGGYDENMLPSKIKYKLIVVSSGEKIYEKELSLIHPDLTIPLDLKLNKKGKGYVRVMIEESSGMKIFVNPFFYAKNKTSFVTECSDK